MDLMIGSLNFHVGSLGSVCLSDLINLGPSAGKTASMENSKTSVGSSSEVNSAVSIKLTKSKGNIVEELDKIMENLDLEESSGYSNTSSDKNINNILEEDFTCCGDVSDNFEDTWRSGLKLNNDEQTPFYSDPNQCINNRHQVYVVINDTYKEVDVENNLVINPQNLERGANHRAEGETDSAVARREKVYLSAEEWQMIKVVVNHGTVIPTNVRREVLTGYQYALH
jgi:hypothetical protein